jgi:L-glyceraldehyde 3-phosphate reductase
MQCRRVGKWGLKLPEISLGLWHNFGGTAPLERSREIWPDTCRGPARVAS